jgi:hypothetical protein
VAQKPLGRVMPTALPLQSVAAAWAGAVADHDISIITAVTKKPRPPDQRTIELINDKFFQGIAYLRVILRLSPEPKLQIHIAAPPSLFHSARTATLFK